MLTGNEGRWQGESDAAAVSAALATRLHGGFEEHRFTILFGLARLDLTPRVSALLETSADSHRTSGNGSWPGAP